MQNSTATNHEELVGGWSPYHKLTTEDKIVFDEALRGFVGIKYTPNKVSSQVIAGTNYRFKCTAQVPHSEVVWDAIVEIFRPLTGKPHITGIVRI
jgi:hypothetical protein